MPKHRLKQQLRTFLVANRDNLYRHQLSDGFKLLWDFDHGAYFDTKAWEADVVAWTTREDIKTLWEQSHPLAK